MDDIPEEMIQDYREESMDDFQPSYEEGFYYSVLEDFTYIVEKYDIQKVWDDLNEVVKEMIINHVDRCRL